MPKTPKHPEKVVRPFVIRVAANVKSISSGTLTKLFVLNNL